MAYRKQPSFPTSSVVVDWNGINLDPHFRLSFHKRSFISRVSSFFSSFSFFSLLLSLFLVVHCEACAFCFVPLFVCFFLCCRLVGLKEIAGADCFLAVEFAGLTSEEECLLTATAFSTFPIIFLPGEVTSPRPYAALLYLFPFSAFKAVAMCVSSLLGAAKHTGSASAQGRVCWSHNNLPVSVV